MNAQATKRTPSEVDAWSERFRTACRERGIRVTTQRLEIYKALAGDLTHPSVETLYERLAVRLPTLSLATVYRVLESLEEEGLVRRLNLSDGAARFDANVSPHQHLVCRVCGLVRDTELPGLAEIDARDITPPGFIAEHLDIRIRGACAKCVETT